MIVSPAKTAEPIKIPFGLWTGVGLAVCAAAANILSASLQPNRATAAADISRRAPPICGSDVDFFPLIVVRQSLSVTLATSISFCNVLTDIY